MQGLNMKKEDLIKIIKKYLEKEDQKKVEKTTTDFFDINIEGEI